MATQDRLIAGVLVLHGEKRKRCQGQFLEFYGPLSNYRTRHLNRPIMRSTLLLIFAMLGFSQSSHAAVAECPLSLSLKTNPDTFIESLKTLNSAQSRRSVMAPPTTGQCDYRVSVIDQSGGQGGLCTIGGKPAYVAFTNVLDSKSQVLMDIYMISGSLENLPSIRSALSKIGTPVTRTAEPRAWVLPNNPGVVDAVYGHEDELWIVSHPEVGPNGPQGFVLMHVLREWLDFAQRDPTKCAEIPSSKGEDP
ncbi:hypothetical protein ACN9MB_17460 [Dyella kyungheensis]|uniref:hypothetical protein n=1 Tax=Dyella kyungheensis TaxID=1242174 RepID=UPI003CF79E8D